MDALYQSRLEGLSEQIDNYLWLHHDTGSLSAAQRNHLKELCDTIVCFGEVGAEWAKQGMELYKQTA